MSEQKRKCEEECRALGIHGPSVCTMCQEQTREVRIFGTAILLSIIFSSYRVYCMFNNIVYPSLVQAVFDVVSLVGFLFLVSVLPFAIKVIYQTSRGYIT